MPRKPQYKPWHPEPYDPGDVSAIQAMFRGDATEEQAQRGTKWIIESLCRTYDVDYVPDSDRDTSFAAGKRWVGQQLVKLIKLNVSKITKNQEPTEQG